jgi:hypothetical protein
MQLPITFYPNRLNDVDFSPIELDRILNFQTFYCLYLYIYRKSSVFNVWFHLFLNNFINVKGIHVVYFRESYRKAETKALEDSRKKLFMELATRTRLETRRVQQRDDASTSGSDAEEEKSDTEAEKAKKDKKAQKAAQVKRNKEMVVERRLRVEARDKRKREEPEAPPPVEGPKGPKAKPGRRWAAKAVAVGQEVATEAAVEGVPPESVAVVSASVDGVPPETVAVVSA